MLALAARTKKKPKNRISGYFQEPPEDRKKRLADERERVFQERNALAQELFESGQLEALFEATMPLVINHARKLKRFLEFDDFTFEDIVQAGRVGLWRAINAYNGEGWFRGYAAICFRRSMWKEFNRLMSQAKRGFEPLDSEELVEFPGDECCVRLADTEAVGVVMEVLDWLPEQWQEIALARASGERLCVVANNSGCSLAHACRVYKKAIAHLEEIALPQMLGAWTPCPSVIGDVWHAFESADPQFEVVSEMAECEHCRKPFRVEHGNHRYCSECSKARDRN